MARPSIQPDRTQFHTLCKAGNMIPVVTEIPADLETPVSTVIKLGGCSFLLESVEGGEQIGRYSFIGVDPLYRFEVQEGRVRIQSPEGVQEEQIRDPLQALEAFMARFHPATIQGLPKFFGGAVGYLSYDVVQYWEPVPSSNCELDLPQAFFTIPQIVLAFDHLKHRIQIIFNAQVNADPDTLYDQAVERLTQLRTLLGAPLPVQTPETSSSGELRSNMSADEYQRAVIKAQEAITAGEAFQIVLSQRFSLPTSMSALNLYRNLRSINPSPYLFYIDQGRFELIGSSPEAQVRYSQGRAEVRPIAGTRPRGQSSQEDEQRIKELLSDEKELAEHTMLVDLGRNDLGRVCEYGSVEVKEFLHPELYSHVIHLVSSVQGRLAPEKSIYDLVRATFPCGTVSGAPKVRAMQLIRELEPDGRGPYAGLAGYFGFSGTLDTCIIIRTLILMDQVAHLQTGAGIVADSVPIREYQETLNKAMALLDALEVVM